MKIYLDDERTTPDGYTRVYWPAEAIELLTTGAVTEISLDHDLGGDNRGTGYDVVLWIEEQVALHGFVPPAMKVHSANVSARTKMESGIRAIEAMVKKRTPNQDSRPAQPNRPPSCDPACPVCGVRLIDIRAKLQCSVCHRICETCCEGDRG
ncbi:cyclic-phosphate processing receiver domain-containing protein [Allorhodopirellula solitaria]|uniref:Cyclic-phosphate processing Receiver domain-containing protein n=1 Tax=Allorhodopirellula solitaria TaxID=2527987 RepID=A0A5C5XTT7_9BACT|nr:cyclic-phosphate processing receiver domain-containing protein [Allorhodopirellula solitaria]TWT66706.1 hypothetical protein CA85_28030 [Allorhodopirellula solitaria]